ncbi:hypothetical protein MAR_008777 [Mya arenaria]|uniref:Uncharacterized protein n=1 Tax=Mya arenaria TaxID=6604 RepID=A0ABY7DZ63_MYAAR|nr:hypothetical protein MAR_008777 [Mya arenaria]
MQGRITSFETAQAGGEVRSVSLPAEVWLDYQIVRILWDIHNHGQLCQFTPDLVFCLTQRLKA